MTYECMSSNYAPELNCYRRATVPTPHPSPLPTPLMVLSIHLLLLSAKYCGCSILQLGQGLSLPSTSCKVIFHTHYVAMAPQPPPDISHKLDHLLVQTLTCTWYLKQWRPFQLTSSDTPLFFSVNCLATCIIIMV